MSGPLKRAPGGEADSEKLLADLAREGEAARARAEAAESAMLSLGDITKLHEDAWRDSALERDQALGLVLQWQPKVEQPLGADTRVVVVGDEDGAPLCRLREDAVVLDS